ncbi:S-adenosyl-L-methionine-dependent methyltransferase [Cristinia sonorae]|uniref:S-adenosyl-L-methionine-dependent methyltransferase n=1 Tax=Cristinia sonorae TaxID=1940300 RepID=A0A8K0UTE0_9AGAR|nr:S-adenosyl-L-methionine-dependent methyltransferase [Cristinia sonorae]
MSSPSHLTALLQIISDGVNSIEADCNSRNLQYPTLEDPLTPDSIALQEGYAQDALPVIAAAYQLMATLMSPHSFYHKMIFAADQTIALGVAEAGHVAEILREGGPEGVHVSDITAKNKMEPKRLAHCLRFLSSLHIFKEVSPDCFTNNRVSATLDTGKPVSEILLDPEAKYDNAPGFAALTGSLADEALKAGSYVVDALTDPKTSHSQEPRDGAHQRAFGVDLDLFSWYEMPENAFRLRRFGNAMRSMQWSAPVTGGFDWAGLKEGSVVVDIGGGFGGLDVDLAKTFKHLKFVVQDRPQVAEEATKACTLYAPFSPMWRAQGNQDVLDGRVTFQGHDFFTPQPSSATPPSVFFLRYVLHNWNDTHSIRILKHLRAAASPHTQLLIIGALIAYNCPSEGKWKDVPGGEVVLAPEPLLPNFGIACSDASFMDILLIHATNTHERTLDELVAVFDASGWKLKCVHRFPPPAIPQIVAVPA